MAWIKVPPENHPVFHAALPKDARVETSKMFGGVVAKVNGHIFAGLFGRSVMVWLPEAERASALALQGASWFDPMGDGRARSEKIMLPEAMMKKPAELRRWLARALRGAAALPPKKAKVRRAAKSERAAKVAAGSSRPKSKTTFASVDDYIASQPKATRRVLERVRSAIRKAVPRSEEAISYQIPTYKLRGKPVLYFAGWKEHYSLYPVSARVVTAFKHELSPYEVKKSTARFPLTQPVPAKLIERIAKFRAKEIAGGPGSR